MTDVPPARQNILPAGWVSGWPGGRVEAWTPPRGLQLASPSRDPGPHGAPTVFRTGGFRAVWEILEAGRGCAGPGRHSRLTDVGMSAEIRLYVS